jgi:hypothetical protein
MARHGGIQGVARQVPPFHSSYRFSMPDRTARL